MGIICMVNLHNSTALSNSTYFFTELYALGSIPLPQVSHRSCCHPAAEGCGPGPTTARISSPKDGRHPAGH